MVLILIAVTVYIVFTGYSYYHTSLEDRFYHENHELLKPNGLIGSWHGNYRIHFHGVRGIDLHAAKKDEISGTGGQIEALAGVPHFSVYPGSHSGAFSYLL